MTTVLSKNEFYPLAHRYPKIENQSTLRAVWTGEKRKPKAGEWFLSGSYIEAYKAVNDSSLGYPIAKIVVVEKKEIWEIVEELP